MTAATPIRTVDAGEVPPQRIRSAVEGMLDDGCRLIFVRHASPAHHAALDGLPYDVAFHSECALIVVGAAQSDRSGVLVVVSAGTTDMPMAEEVSVAAEALGMQVRRVGDVGVAGLHRLLFEKETLEQADCIVAIAGMEGALPSVVTGLVSRPVIAVPTSVGYGASLNGLAAMLGMLASSALGMAVVNVDGGVAAAVVADRIVRVRARQ
jgi:pyridinium-3,5-biscarboxylic acid mononucleotide synthase